MLMSVYDRLAADPTPTNLWWLMYASTFDERVYNVADKHKLMPAIADQLPNPAAAHFLARGIVYDSVNVEVMRRFIKICSLLSRYEGVEQGTTLAELVGACGIPEENRQGLFNFSETYRHMAIDRQYFPHRGMLKLLAYIFCDDLLSDAVATLQSKSDVINHVSRIYCDTADFVSWRFAVRVLSLAGGYAEDRIDVDDTENLCRLVTKGVPDFITYFGAAFAYGMFRHNPRRVKGVVPTWLVRHRAAFTGLVTGCLGVYINSYLDYKIHREKLKFELRKSQEMRRRAGAKRYGKQYQENPFFDNLEGMSKRVWGIQAQTYAVAGTVLATTMLPLTSVKFPAFMGDVVFKFPTIPRLFPALVNIKTSSRCLIPYVVAPFTIVSIAQGSTWNVSLYDRLVQVRQGRYERKHGLEKEAQ